VRSKKRRRRYANSYSSASEVMHSIDLTVITFFLSQSKKAAKKQVTAEEDGPSSDPVAPSSSANSASPAAASSSASAPSSSSSAAAGSTSTTGTSSATKKAARVPRVIRPVDPDEIKIQDAERMAQQLLEVSRVLVEFVLHIVDVVCCMVLKERCYAFNWSR